MSLVNISIYGTLIVIFILLSTQKEEGSKGGMIWSVSYIMMMNFRGAKKQNKPFTLGPEVEKLIIIGIGLICAPLSFSITWKNNSEVKGNWNVFLNQWIHIKRTTAIRKLISVYFWPYTYLSFHGRVYHRVQGFHYGTSCQTCSVFFLP